MHDDASDNRIRDGLMGETRDVAVIRTVLAMLVFTVGGDALAQSID